MKMKTEKDLLKEALQAVRAAESAVQTWRNYNPSGDPPSWERLTATLSPREGLLKSRLDLEKRLHELEA